VKSAASPATTYGFCSWKPQPSCSPPARSEISSAASSTNESTTPTLYAMPDARRPREPGAASPSTFSDSTGNTQGMRFSSAPPTSANSSAIGRPSAEPPAAFGEPCAVGVAGAATAAGAPGVDDVGGHGVVTETVTARPAAPSTRAGWPSAEVATSTAGIAVGDSLRCGSSGTRVCHRSPFHAACCGAAFAITPAVSGRNSSVRPRQAAGSPSTCTTTASPSTVAFAAAPGTARGTAALAASNSAACPPVAACAGTLNANSPDSGMHTSLQTSHSALSVTSSCAPLKAGATVSGTGSSTVSS
jgi:hypothetical protein